MASVVVGGVGATSASFYVSPEGAVHIEYSITEDPQDSDADQVTLFLDPKDAEAIISDLTEAIERCKALEDALK